MTGGTGLIGRSIACSLLARGDQVVIVTRRAEEARGISELKGAELVQGDPMVPEDWELAVDGCDAVINLVGQSIFAGRWSIEVRRLIRDSRVYGTGHVLAAAARANNKPAVWVQASAIGFYGSHADEELTELSPPGTDFMASVCKDWEAAAAPVSKLGIRLATIRTGIVLDRREGILGQLTPIFKYVPGGAAPIGSGVNPYSPGSGRQWMSWIHLKDIVGIYLLALDHPAAVGPLNGTAPNPVRNYEFGRTLAHTLWRPFLPFGPPDALLKKILGDVADVVTSGQKVMPSRVELLGYRFAYPELKQALRQIYQPAKSASASLL